jgi:hypothetical protein
VNLKTFGDTECVTDGNAVSQNLSKKNGQNIFKNCEKVVKKLSKKQSTKF